MRYRPRDSGPAPLPRRRGDRTSLRGRVGPGGACHSPLTVPLCSLSTPTGRPPRTNVQYPSYATALLLLGRSSAAVRL